jgi:hypothetical protein
MQLYHDSVFAYKLGKQSENAFVMLQRSMVAFADFGLLEGCHAYSKTVCTCAICCWECHGYDTKLHIHVQGSDAIGQWWHCRPTLFTALGLGQRTSQTADNGPCATGTAPSCSALAAVPQARGSI